MSEQLRRCLVVDDDDAIREIVVINLEAEGMEVHTASDGEQAKAMVRELLPDIMVLDVMMPGCNGYEVLQAMKADPLTSGIPVVMLTARATDSDVWDGWQSGADYFLTKPFNVEELLHFVNMVFGD